MLENFKKIIKNRKLLLVLAAGVLSSIGSRVGFIAIMSVFTSDETYSVLGIGFYTLLTMLPDIVLGPFIGTYVDRHRKVPIMLVGDVLRALCLLSLFFFRPLFLIYILTVVQAIIDSFFFSARFVFQRYIIKDDEVIAAQSVSSMSRDLINIMGPAIGGMILGFFGIKTALLFDAATFMTSFVLLYPLLKLRLPETRSVEEKQVSESLIGPIKKSFDEIRHGLSLMSNNRPMLMALFAYVFTVLICESFAVLMFPLGKESFHLPMEKISMFLTMLGLGSLIATFIYLKINKVDIKPLFLFILLDGLALFFLTLTQNYYLGLLLIFIMGFPVAAVGISVSSIIQLSIPKDKLATVNSLFTSITTPAALVSIALGSAVAQKIGATIYLRYNAILEILVSMAIILFCPAALLKYKSKKGQSGETPQGYEK